MATQKDVILSGRIGNVIFYKMNGKYYARSAPGRIRQTKPMKAHAKRFGQASSLAAMFRKNLEAIVPNPTDNKMQTRFVAMFFKWIKASENARDKKIQFATEMEGFQFVTEGPDFSHRFKPGLRISPVSGSLIKVDIPAFVPDESISAAPDSISVKLNLAALCVPTESSLPFDGNKKSVVFEFNHDRVNAQTVQLKLEMPKNSLLLVGASLVYTVQKKHYTTENTNKRYMPASILKAVYI